MSSGEKVKEIGRNMKLLFEQFFNIPHMAKQQ